MYKILKWNFEKTFSFVDVLVWSVLVNLIYQDSRWALATWIIWAITCNISRAIDKYVDTKLRS